MVGNVSAGEQRHVQVALSLRDPRGATALAKAVNTPGSAQYGRYLSNREFVNRFAPTSGAVDRVSSWLRDQGLTVNGISANRHYIDVTATVGQLEATFAVKLAKFRVGTKNGTYTLVAPQSAVSVPRAVRGSVQAIVGLDDSARTITPDHITPVRNGRAGGVAPEAPGDPLSCARYWGESNNPSVPQKYADGNQSNVLCGYFASQIRATYGLSGSNTGAGSTVAITGAYNLSTIVADTNRAASHFGAPTLAAGQYDAVLPGSFDRENECGPDGWHSEQALDVQAIHEVAPAAKIIYYGASSCFDLFDALNAAVAENKTSSISNSWGYPGESIAPVAVRQQLDSIALQAAIQGQSLLVSSGDTGDNSAGVGHAEPGFPEVHPWVTAVGGTSVALDANNQLKFVAGWENAGNTQQGSQWAPQQDADGPFAGGAGGGVSNLYGQPDYQRGAVPDGLAMGRRAVPDVAALADAYTGIAVGFTSQQGYVEYSSGGTSAASPIMAGLVADAQQAQGVDRLGFLNTALYELIGNPAMTDVVQVRAGVWTSGMVSFGGVTVPPDRGSYLVDFDTRPQSLQSGPGWDPVTGVGTPNAAFLTAIGK
jgi:subtilase family serine protease